MAGKTLTITPEELEALVRKAVRAEFDHVGLTVSEHDHVESAREDFRFMRRFRIATDKASGIIGKAVIGAIAAVFIAAMIKGFSISK
jgi:hypothetical protein